MDDDIRRQRLARFAQIAETEERTLPDTASPKPHAPQQQAQAPAKPEKPPQPEPQPAPQVRIPAKPSPSPAPADLTPEQLKVYESRAIASILGVAMGAVNNTIDLSETAQFVEDFDPQWPFQLASFDVYIFGVLGKIIHTPQTLFGYLFSCWDRASRMARAAATVPAKLEIVEGVREQLVYYGAMFGCADEGEAMHADLGAGIYQASFPPWDYIERMFEDEDNVLTIAPAVVKHMALQLMQSGYKSNYHHIFTSVERLFSIKIVAQLYHKAAPIHDSQELTPMRFLASNPLLGLFSFSPLDVPFCMAIFPSPSTMTREQINRVVADTQPETLLIMNRLFSIADKVVRGSPESRSYLMSLLTKTLNRNRGRMAMQVDPNKVHGDGFMLNITFVLVKFCMPFVDFSGKSLSKISVEFFRSPAAQDLTDETRLVADSNESAEWSSKSSGDPNFVSQVFFLAAGYLQYGAAATIQAEKTLKRQVEAFTDRMRQVEEREASGQVPAPMIARVKQQMQAGLDLFKARLAALGCVLLSEAVMTPIYEFSTFVLIFVMHAARSEYPPLSIVDGETGGEPTPAYRTLPEFLVEAPVAVLVYIMQNITGIVRRDVRSEQLEAVIFFLLFPQYIKNPYLKSRLVELPFYGCMDQLTTMGGSIEGFFRPAFANHPVVQRYLLRALVKLYVDMEQTGRSAQFYEKFSTRELISYIIDVLWNYPVYRLRLEEESRDHPEFFERFVALLLNDSTYLLDEALSKLQEIRRLQLGENVERPANEEGGNEEEEEEGQLAAAERQVKSFLHLGSKTVDLLNRFTSSVPELFLKKEIIDRLASMLNYNLVALVGPKCRELVVKTPQEYGWNPRDLLARIAQVYLNLRQSDDFVRALVRDGRSFSIDLFQRASSILKKRSLVSPQAIKEWDQLTADAEGAQQAEIDAEAELGEIPDEFLDPLMYTLMEDPVILPSSRVTMDLSTIKAHLLSDPIDPFNRMPLKIEEVVPNRELYERIQEFKRQRKALRSHSTT
ncbi:E4 ubiquitin-protein ligase UFD2 [Wickerhamiella sorbophila]|uniref:RING-type E3 ubiquitin transferase n=1 Tax=Wickerhamiella sorbophila TaxID=45607 RepID=A0A2T0FQ45_9ASCO|nr:E4 ubiquitin-protein ligase UFD2 [Wickerhamiella sorbophila]PRT57087.1 E4 ubiquitin-protein ligase UFD2 [Wickerhamiella sorbophila]